MMTLQNLCSPDLASVISVLKALLAGEVSRDEVVAWRKSRITEAGGDSSGALSAYVVTGCDAIKENLGRYAFGNLGALNLRVDNGLDQKPYFFRSCDLQMILAELERDFEPHRWKSLVEMPPMEVREKGWREIWLVEFSFPTTFDFWPKGLWSHRFLGDMPYLNETCHFYFQEEPFYLARGLDDLTNRHALYLWWFSDNADPKVDSAVVVALVKELGLSWTDVSAVSPSAFPVERYGLYRYDDNGGEYLMERFNNFLTAEMTRQMYEDRGHKQIYYLKRETEPLQT